MPVRPSGGLLPRLVLACLATIALIGVARAEEPPIGRQVGTSPGDFTLRDASTGQDVSLFYFRGKKAAVLVWMGTDCPVGNAYMPRLSELAKKYGPDGVVFLGINSNAHETAEQVAAHAKEFSAAFPVLKDVGGKVAEQYQAKRTCEVVLLDEKAVVRYRGMIDDQIGIGSRRPKAVQNHLSDAIDALLAGKPIDTTATTVVGCPIEKADAKSSASNAPKVRAPSEDVRKARDLGEEAVKVGDVTYAKDVATILQNRCQGCHRPKGAAPFALLSFDDANRWSASIREVVSDRRMPPWHADPRHGKFSNDRSLSAREKATLIAWVDQGTPLGDPRAIPPARVFADGWNVGKPDVVFEMPAPYTVPAEGVVQYQWFRVPTGFTEDKWVQSIEPMPGDRSVVHHIVVYLDDKTKGGPKEPEHLGGYAPGELPSVYPDGIAKRVPAGSDLVLQVHYTPNGKVRVDRSRVGLIFAKAAPEHRAITKGVANPRLKIPAGADNYEVKSRFKFGQDAHLLSFMPHMHLRGKDFEYRVVYPDGKTDILLSVPAYDFAWQSYYRLETPLAMPKGTVIECTAHFDNSTKNPFNPDPSKEVRWGDQTWDEMMIGYIDYYPDATVGPTTPGAGLPPAKPGGSAFRNVAGQLLKTMADRQARSGASTASTRDRPR